MENLKTFLEKYEIDQTESLDQKYFGSVYKGIDTKTGKEWAIKSTETHPNFDENLFLDRYNKAQELDHPNLLPYKEAYRFVEGMVTNMAVMPVIEMGSLDAFLDLDAADKKLISDQVLDGLYYLHGHDLVWQNLSARHILLTKEFGNYVPLFINYGSQHKIPLAFFSDYEYLAPEQFDPESEIDLRSDIWAYGVLLYSLWAGRLPFGEKSASLSNSKIQERILGDWEPGLLAQIPQPYQGIVEKCLQRKKEARWDNCGEIIVVIKNWVEPIITTSSKDLEPEQRFLRKPNKPIVWWQVVVLLLLAAALGYWVNGY